MTEISLAWLRDSQTSESGVFWKNVTRRPAAESRTNEPSGRSAHDGESHSPNRRGTIYPFLYGNKHLSECPSGPSHIPGSPVYGYGSWRGDHLPDHRPDHRSRFHR